ncbi:hypothetical protein BV22DRAFT_1016479 [Leucogyrophana mollusca]|uniref:Uncharacterized protein n=1 Tax=Leucogyrophana mollusca TaxID=85980 RepID=A0ACB8BDR8_9AGAM|nr:hypothetical protein BV22DRAFT_1016479 [Leucogyrophana mollusca]
MVFAPPSPTGPSNPPSPTYHRRFSSSSSASSLAPLEFAPPSPMSDTGKPPLPTTPKPVFRRRDRRRLDKRSLSASPHPAFTKFANPLPPTTNVLDANERADLIRRNRKLAQVFGQTPGAEMLATDGDEPRLFKILPPPALAAFLGLAKQRNHRHAMSVSVALKTPGHRTEPTSPWQVLDNPWSPGRRHSSPLSPDGFTLYFDSAGAATDQEYTASCSRDPHYHAGPPTSFIDLSDEDILNDGASAISGLSIPKKGGRSRDYRYSTTTPSLAESLSPEAQLEADKRRKREKLAKLHRFLGSRVPTDLVVGALAAPSLPPSPHPDFTTEDASRPIWMQRRRSGSALPTRSEPFDRVKEELGGEEKALNVRRAQKMEKVFGIPPPQTLYHTRPLPSVPVHSQPTSPTGNVSPPFYPSISPVLERNLNQSAYTKTKGKRYERPGTSESTRLLLPNTPNTSVSVDYGSGYQDVLARSTVYMNYHQSLNSLTDIIDRVSGDCPSYVSGILNGKI